MTTYQPIIDACWRQRVRAARRKAAIELLSVAAIIAVFYALYVVLA